MTGVDSSGASKGGAAACRSGTTSGATARRSTARAPIHAAGEDLDLVVEWCEPGPGVTVLDVATGGGHVARRLREAGATVVTVDPAPGMQADTTATAEDLPFADGSFDAVACRLAAHHFADVIAAVKEMARVAKHRVVICDNTFVSESSEEADRLRDPSHVRNYSQPEWHSFFELAGLEVADERYLERPLEIEPWLARVELHRRRRGARA